MFERFEVILSNDGGGGGGDAGWWPGLALVKVGLVGLNKTCSAWPEIPSNVFAVSSEVSLPVSCVLTVWARPAF